MSNVIVVGFDLGHAETAVSWLRAGRDTPPAVVDLPGATRRQHITAVAEHPQRGVLIGEEAAVARGTTSFYMAFKSSAVEEETVRRPVRLFVQKIVNDLGEAGLLPSGPVRWVFGAPSGWASDRRDAYIDLLHEIGLEDVEVVPESRAALLYARDAREVTVSDQQLAGAVLVVDIGSSTTDYTSLVGRANQLIDHGNVRLGARLIDRQIMNMVLDRHPEQTRLEEVLADDPAERLRLELLCRKAKENFFSTPQERFRHDPQARVGAIESVATPDGDDILVDIRLSMADIDTVLDTPQPSLGDRSWRQSFREDLQDAVDRLGQHPDVVLLTGGPSKMGFVLDVCREAVGLERVLRGPEPEVAISRGLALAGRMGVRVGGFRRDIQKLIDDDEFGSVVSTWLSGFTQKLGEAVADGITERHFIPAFHRWRNGEIETLNEVEVAVSEALGADLADSGNVRMATAMAAWQNELRPRLEDLTRPICTRWGLSPRSLTPPPIIIDARGISVPFSTTAATKSLESIMGVTAGVVAAVVWTPLLGGGVALIATTGPLAPVMAVLATAAVMYVGRDTAMARVRATHVPLTLRRGIVTEQFVAKLTREAPAKEKEIADKLADQFLRNHREKLTHAVTQSIVTQFKALAADAEMEIAPAQATRVQ